MNSVAHAVYVKFLDVVGSNQQLYERASLWLLCLVLYQL